MSGAGASDRTGGPDFTHPVLVSDAAPASTSEARLEGEMLPRSPSGGPNTAAGRPRQVQGTKSTASPSSIASPPASQVATGMSRQSSLAQAQARAYSQQVGYPWYQSQRSAPYQQSPLSAGQLGPYGWLPYHMGYQIYGDQFAQQAFYQEGQPLNSYQLPYGSHQDVTSYAMGSGNQAFMQQPYFPHMLPMPQSRGLPLRAAKTAEEAADSYNFDPAEARENPGRARTTLMLRNIPNKYTIHMLLEMLDKCHKRGTADLVYDFCYLPIDFKNRCNLGYAFVNFVDAAYTAECYSTFNAKRWNDFNSKKVCEVKYARVQGKEALIDHFRNSKFPSNDVDCLPLLFEKVVESGEEIVRSVPLHSRQTT